MAGVVVGVIRWELRLPGCASLKEKRQVLRSLKDRLRHRFRVSVAETDHQDTWTSAELAAAVIAADVAFVQSVLDRLDDFVGAHRRVLVSSRHRELL